jgi:hypothetical protein
MHDFRSNSINNHSFHLETTILLILQSNLLTQAMASKFYVPVDIQHTALLLADVQDQILNHFDATQQATYLANI